MKAIIAHENAQVPNPGVDTAERPRAVSDWRDASGRFVKGRPVGRPKGAKSRSRRLWEQATATTPPEAVRAAGIERLWYEEVYYALQGDEDARREVFGMLRMRASRRAGREFQSESGQVL